jgi:hypothetical protein
LELSGQWQDGFLWVFFAAAMPFGKPFHVWAFHQLLFPFIYVRTTLAGVGLGSLAA